MTTTRPSSQALWRERLYRIIFESDTPAGKSFDVVLIVLIVLSVIAVMLESVAALRSQYGTALRTAEWFFTILFTIEYGLRLLSAPSAERYAVSFFGVIDFLAIVPTYLSVLVPGAQFLLVIRLFRILRVFRVLRLVDYLTEADVLVSALRSSRRKITVFIVTVMTVVVVFGSLMYFVEGETNGFTSIPTSMYWAIVTLTTVGYGDISPQTGLGQMLAAAIMLLGYAIIAVPTGIVTVELSRAERQRQGLRSPIVPRTDEAPVIYEITAAVDPDVVERFEQFMRQRHIPDLMATGCFDAADFTRSGSGGYRIAYHAPHRRALDRYLDRHAERLSGEVFTEFRNGVNISREVWTCLARFRPPREEETDLTG